MTEFEQISKEIEERIAKLKKFNEKLNEQCKKDNYIHAQLIREAELIEIIRFSTICAIDPKKFSNLEEIRKFLTLLIEDIARELKVSIETDAETEQERFVVITIETQIDEIDTKDRHYRHTNSNYKLRYDSMFKFETNAYEIITATKNRAFSTYIYNSECNTIHILKFAEKLSEMSEDSRFFYISDFAHDEIYIPEFDNDNLFSDFEVEDELDFVTTDGAMRATLKRK